MLNANSVLEIRHQKEQSGISGNSFDRLFGKVRLDLPLDHAIPFECIRSLVLVVVVALASVAMSDWGTRNIMYLLLLKLTWTCTEESESETGTPAAPAARKAPAPKKSKWEGEDEEEDGPVVCTLPYNPHTCIPYFC